MANDVYTYLSFPSDSFESFTENLMKEKDEDQMMYIQNCFYPEAEMDEYGLVDFADLIGSKWCHINHLDSDAIEFHSAWCAPSVLVQKMVRAFGIPNPIQVEDLDAGILGRVYHENDGIYARCLTQDYVDCLVESIKTYHPKIAKYLEETEMSFRDDHVWDRYEMVDWIAPVEYGSVYDAIEAINCFNISLDYREHTWRFSKENFHHFRLEVEDVTFDPSDFMTGGKYYHLRPVMGDDGKMERIQNYSGLIL